MARLGSINLHPALLPRHRGPIPLAWALRDGDGRFGITWHRMDAELDTGGILGQTSIPIEDDDIMITDFGPKIGTAAFGLLPRVLERVAAGDPGDAQSEEGASWAGHFEDDEYARVDWSQPVRRIHDQVRAWNLTFVLADVVGPVAELDGERLRLVRTSLRDPGDGSRRIECGDGPLWIVESTVAARIVLADDQDRPRARGVARGAAATGGPEPRAEVPERPEAPCPRPPEGGLVDVPAQVVNG